MGAVSRGGGAVLSGHGALSPTGAYYGAKTAGRIAESLLGEERANQPIFRGKPPVNPGAPLPEPPGPELLQGNALMRPGAAPPGTCCCVGQCVGEAGLSRRRPAGASRSFPRAPEPTLPPEARLPAAFQPLAPKPPALPGTPEAPLKTLTELPTPAVHQALQELGPQASIDDITSRANELAGNTIPRTLSGESALREVFPGNKADLMGITKSRGLSTSRESQLVPGVASKLLINKIIDDFSPEELDEISAQYLENTRMGHHDFGNLQAQGVDKATAVERAEEAWNVMKKQTYFPDLKIPAAELKRAQATLAAAKGSSPEDPP